LEEFGVETYGVDISATAVHAARNLSTASGFEGLAGRLEVTKGEGLAFNDKQFDFVLCDSVLDSMHFEIAKSLMKEFERVAKNYVFISLISGDDSSHYREFGGEEVVETEHEEGTIQSYFNYSKIEDLVAGTELSLKWGRLVSEESIVDQYKLSRYWLLFEQK
jgi:ubiquinone/menaquinone biosynthesis C-methylase UbiE